MRWEGDYDELERGGRGLFERIILIFIWRKWG